MDNLAYHGGKNLKRAIEATGRRPTLNHYVVALWLAAQDENEDIEQIVTRLIAARDYDPKKNGLDKDARIKQLGF